MLNALKAELKQRKAADLLRKRRLLSSPQDAQVIADGKRLLSFASNDYLGLANHPEIITALYEGAKNAGVGSGASHLITGHHAYHEALEHALAQFVGLPAALLFTTGYMANLGVISALLGRDDAIFADKLNHASLNEAAVLCRANLQRFAHNDMEALEALLMKSNAKRKLIAVDAVFSMDGDIAPINSLLTLCERFDAYLLLDDAHGFGVLGQNGEGVLSHFNVQSERIIYMATLGKAAGVAGAFVASSQIMVDYLIQTAKSYIYTTASPPALSAALLKALEIIAKDQARKEHLKHLISYFKMHLNLKHWQLMPSDTAIQPVVVGSNENALALSEYLLTQHILVPAIRPPTVPNNTARLRVSLSAAHSEQDVIQLISAIQQAEKALVR